MKLIWDFPSVNIALMTQWEYYSKEINKYAVNSHLQKMQNFWRPDTYICMIFLKIAFDIHNSKLKYFIDW